jgi:hypothetical protein
MAKTDNVSAKRPCGTHQYTLLWYYLPCLWMVAISRARFANQGNAVEEAEVQLGLMKR